MQSASVPGVIRGEVFLIAFVRSTLSECSKDVPAGVVDGVEVHCASRGAFAPFQDCGAWELTAGVPALSAIPIEFLSTERSVLMKREGDAS